MVSFFESIAIAVVNVSQSVRNFCIVPALKKKIIATILIVIIVFINVILSYQMLSNKESFFIT